MVSVLVLRPVILVLGPQILVLVLQYLVSVFKFWSRLSVLIYLASHSLRGLEVNALHSFTFVSMFWLDTAATDVYRSYKPTLAYLYLVYT